MATAPSRPPARTTVKRLEFAFPFRRASSDPRKPSVAFTDQHEFLSLLRKESLGAYAVSRKGLWHGGVHVSDAGAGKSFDLKHGVRCMADGEVVAWRVNRNYLKIDLPAFSAQYSSGFALVRHVMEFPKDCTLTFHSLYMHLQDLAGYASEKTLQRPAYWTTWFKVTSGARNRQTAGSTHPGLQTAQVGLQVLATKSGGTILGILPHGAQFSVLKREGDWAQIDAIHVGSMVPSKVGGYVDPTAAHKGWVFLGKDGSAAVVEAFVPETAVDRVVVPRKPVPIKAGALIGHLGRDDSLAEMQVIRGVHLEMFCDNSIRSFIDKGRSWIAENAAKPKAWEQLGLSAAPTILRIDRQTKLYKKPHREGRDAPETDVVRAFTQAELERRTDKPFTEDGNGTDGKKRRWWKVESADVRRQDISGWVREENFPGGRISREFAQKWVDFELFDAAHDQTHTIFATTAGYLDYITGANVPHPGARDKLSPLMQMACQHLYKRGDGLQAANDLCVASQDPWTAVGASRLIVKHESEWANPEKWTPLIAEFEKISRNREALTAEHRRIQALTWWTEVKAHYPALPDPKVFHIHPIGMVGNFGATDDCECGGCYVDKFIVTRLGSQYGPVYFGNRPLERSEVLLELAESGTITTSERRIMVGMSPNEGNLDSVHSYDSEIVTAGAMQKTINRDGFGELPRQVAHFRAADEDAYQELFEKCGWSVEGRGEETRMYYSHPLLTNGKKITGRELRDKIRENCSANSFRKKVDNVPLAAIVHAMMDKRYERLQLMDFMTRLRIQILPEVPSNCRFPIGDYFQSDLGRATALDHHVNRPAWVRQDIGSAVRRFFDRHPNVSQNPAEWGVNRVAYEREIVEDYGVNRRMAVIGTQSVAPGRYRAMAARLN
jgi:hypothetical protein